MNCTAIAPSPTAEATKCILISTGPSYRKLNVDGCERFEGSGVYYAATAMEAQLCGGAQVVIVGDGNSAGQAAVYLSERATKVLLLILGDDLGKHMSPISTSLKKWGQVFNRALFLIHYPAYRGVVQSHTSPNLHQLVPIL